MSTQSQPADHRVREQALDPTRSFIVEAPAGSGKTELLTRRYLRLLACVQQPEEILAITFTRKAAAEMRERVLKALSLNAESAVTPMQREVAVLAQAVHIVDREHGWNLLDHPARLRIMTIDALNSSLARQLPILSGAGASLAITRDADALYSEVALRITERLADRNDTAESIARLFRHLDNRYDLFASLLAQELERREHWLDLGLMQFDVATLRPQLEAALEEIINAQLAKLHAQVPRDIHDELSSLARFAAAVLNSAGSETPITACQELNGLPRPFAKCLSEWRGLAEMLLTAKGEWRQRIDKNIGFPAEQKAMKQRVTTVLQYLQSNPSLAQALHATRQLPNAEYTDSQWRVLNDLLIVLKLAIAELEVVMRDRSEVDFSANAIAARRALGSVNEPTDLALRLDYRIQHILVDEFQDTSRGQVELLALLTAGWSEGDARTLFCVGDPMQSIYRFRHADVGLFLNMKRHGLNQLRLTPLRLTVNFRAGVPVLEWINKTFSEVLPRADDPERGAVAFTPSSPQVNAAIDGGVFVHALVGDRELARIEEAKQIAALIERSLQKDSDSRIAVLVANRLHLQHIVRELLDRHIAFQALDIDPLSRRPAIQDLVALTRALVHRADRTAWLALLRAPWCGLSLADLHALSEGIDPLQETIVDWISDSLRVQALSRDGQERVRRIWPVLERALANRGRDSLRNCVERTWHALGGPATIVDRAALDDSRAYFDRLETIERSGDLEDVARLEESLTQLYAGASAPIGSARVELMTIHRAKGLEFDVVILPALDSGARADGAPLLRTLELPHLGAPGLLLAPISAVGPEKDPIYSWLEHLDKERAQLEKGRLLYVAATRAEHELHLFGAVDMDEEEICKPRANTLLNLLWPSIVDRFEKQGHLLPVSNERQVAAHVVRTQRLPLDWSPPVPEPAIGGSALRNIIEDEPLHPEFEWVSETARHIGTLVHREIERIARVGVESVVENFESHRGRYRLELAELGVPPHLRDRAADRVAQALTQMANDERGKWLLGAHREAESEFALSGTIGSTLINVIIDRTFIAGDGTRWIVDFKTSTHEGGGREEFLASEIERYRPQLQRYATLMNQYRPEEPIKAALYFPLLGAWREVSV